jgi:iron uptake system EfeUOB component EfeO/EfeM
MDTMEQVAEFLCRDVNELRAKLRELGLSPVELRER